METEPGLHTSYGSDQKYRYRLRNTDHYKDKIDEKHAMRIRIKKEVSWI